MRNMMEMFAKEMECQNKLIEQFRQESEKKLVSAERDK